MLEPPTTLNSRTQPLRGPATVGQGNRIGGMLMGGLPPVRFGQLPKAANRTTNEEAPSPPPREGRRTGGQRQYDVGSSSRSTPTDRPQPMDGVPREVPPSSTPPARVVSECLAVPFCWKGGGRLISNIDAHEGDVIVRSRLGAGGGSEWDRHVRPHSSSVSAPDDSTGGTG
jgi:hypothetical protein